MVDPTGTNSPAGGVLVGPENGYPTGTNSFAGNSTAYPSFLPLIGGIAPLIYADFAAGNYWYNGVNYSTETAWGAAAAVTFTRASSAYYTNSSGLLASAGNNVLRFDYNPSTLAANGILLEGASTNVCKESQTFSNASWTQLNTTEADASGTAPDGNTTAALITDNSTNGAHAIYGGGSAITNGLVYTFSAYLKGGTLRYISVRGEDSAAGFPWLTLDSQLGTIVNNGASGASFGVLSYPNSWYRVWVTFTANPGTGSGNIVLAGSNASTAPTTGSATGNTYVGSGQTFYVWGAQQEQLSFASSYIPTTASSASRSADSLSVPYSASANALAGTFLTKTVNVLNTGNGGRLIGTNSGATPIAILSSNQVQTYSNTGSGLASNIITGTFGSAAKAVTSGSTAPSRALAANGNTPVTDSNIFDVSATTAIYLGSQNGTTNFSYFDLWQFGFWSGTVATSAQVQALSTLP